MYEEPIDIGFIRQIVVLRHLGAQMGQMYIEYAIVVDTLHSYTSTYCIGVQIYSFDPTLVTNNLYTSSSSLDVATLQPISKVEVP